MRRPLALALAIPALALAGLAAGCGDDDDMGMDAPAQTTTQPAPAESAPAESAGGDVTIAMRGIRFMPEDVTISVGDTVTWVNEDPVEHDADARSGEFESELFGEGESFSYTAEAAGAIEYFCSVHPGMDGTITVEE